MRIIEKKKSILEEMTGGGIIAFEKCTISNKEPNSLIYLDKMIFDDIWIKLFTGMICH